MEKIIINDIEFELDMSDADVLQSLENAIPQVIAKTDAIKNERISEIDKIKGMCLAVCEGLDNILGKGSCAKISNKPNSLDTWVAAWQQFNAQLAIIEKTKKADLKQAEKHLLKLPKKHEPNI